MMPAVIREALVDEQNGHGFHWLKRQDCEGIIGAIHEISDHACATAAAKSGQKYIGSVPNILAIAWAKEWGCKPYSREWLNNTRKRLDDPEWAKLKVQYK